MKPLVLGILVVCAPALVLAQAPATAPAGEEWATPPLVQVPPQEEPPWMAEEKPGPEVGLMISESAFGMLTAAGSGLLLYYLVIKPFQAQATASRDPGQQQIADLMFLLGFSSVPLAVSQTQVGLANESRYYAAEGWPAALSGLGAQAAVFGLYYLVRQANADQGEPVLLVGTVVGVPLVEMAVINLTKQPRLKRGPRVGAALTLDDDGTLHGGVPLPVPSLLESTEGPSLGLHLSLLQGRF